ncbi:MAG: response regulator transcription factor [Candidatus Gracilibacteria bacterium]|nr:response regulator transcription factor [Candidatus Gracilibacteria bacterium]MDD5179502.1 response regulator transcription factor [Candidatus Gracilibacteria bacterium]
MQILVADDDRKLNELICSALRDAHLSPEAAYSLSATRDKIRSNKYDLIILDWIFDNEAESGFDLAKQIAEEYPNLPILMLTGKSVLVDKVKALDAGVDDYLVKPFYLPELVARVKSLLRRKRIGEKMPNEIVAGELSLDTNSYEVKLGGKLLDITGKEFQILHLLIQNQDQIVTRRDLIRKIWGEDFDRLTSNTVDVHIRRIRSKLGKYGEKINTLRGIGYRLAP